jgi:serine/threonine-protein kinase RsbW
MILVDSTGLCSMSDLQQQRIVLKRELGELDRLGTWIQAFEGEIDLVPDVAFALELCLEEAIANIIMHGGPTGAGEISVTLQHTSPGLVATIEDDGRQFDPTKAPRRATAQSLDEARPGEHGIQLIRTFATDMRYECNRGLNTLTLTFAAAGAAAVGA